MIFKLKHRYTGVIKECKLGISWTSLFFGPLVPLFRGDIKWFFISLLLFSFTGGLANIYLMLDYNRIYVRDLLMRGFVPYNQDIANLMRQHNVIVEDVDNDVEYLDADSDQVGS